MKGHRLIFKSKVYYLEKRITFLWIFKYWEPLRATHSLGKMKEEIKKLQDEHNS